MVSQRRNRRRCEATGAAASPAVPATSLSASRRIRDLDALSRPGAPTVDLLVIGGGVTGAGIAMDAASRGLSVVLVERHDLAYGTSRWSSKLVHGGLRYLASGDVAIAYESAVERGILMARTAPHLVRPLSQTIALTDDVSRSSGALLRAGTAAGDLLRTAAWTGRGGLGRSRRISADEVVTLAPTVRRAGLRGGLLHHDGQLVDDARFVVALARTAAGFGARVLTRVAAEQVTGTGAVLWDQLTSTSITVDARAVVNAAGVWAGEVDEDIRLRPSRGTHLVLPQRAFGGLRTALTVPVPGERGRFVFALPAAERRVYVGLTDVDAPGPVPDVPAATDAEVDFLLATMSRSLEVPLRREQILGTYAGLRPLLAAGDGATADLSRRHAVVTRRDGLVSVVGGKLTTYRRMASDAVDAAVAQAGIAAGPCRTRDLGVVGSAPYAVLSGVAAPARLVHRYGTEAQAVVALGSTSVPVVDGTDVTEAELRFAVQHEGALDVGDLLDRRTRIGLDAALRERAVASAERILAEA